MMRPDLGEDPVPNGKSRSSLDGALHRQLPRLRAFVRIHMDSFLRTRESCSDLVQSACRELIEQNGSFEFRGDSSLRSWLFKAVLHKIREKRRYHLAGMRSPEREVRAAPEDERLLEAYRQVAEPLDKMLTREQIALFERCLDQLPADYREAISWKHIVGLTTAETAAEMGRSTGSVRNLLQRARCRLATLLDRELNTED